MSVLKSSIVSANSASQAPPCLPQTLNSRLAAEREAFIRANEAAVCRFIYTQYQSAPPPSSRVFGFTDYPLNY